MTNLYDKYILPKVTNALCATKPNMKQREKVVPIASGRVLEIGVGTGLNFRYYNPDKVKELLALDPSEEMWALAESNLGDQNLNIKIHPKDMQRIFLSMTTQSTPLSSPIPSAPFPTTGRLFRNSGESSNPMDSLFSLNTESHLTNP